MKTDFRPLFTLAFMSGFLLLIVVTVGPLAVGRGRPTVLLPADDAPPVFASSLQVDTGCSNTYLITEDASPDRPSDMLELAPLDLSGLTPARLLRLEGQRLRLRAVPDSLVWRVGGRDVFEALMKDASDDLLTVWTYPGVEVEDGMAVEGVMRVVGSRGG
jgi:hypothetical protein